MTRSLVCILVVSVVAPLAVEVPADEDTSSARPPVTRIRASGGLASYAFIARGCEGQVIAEVPVRARDGAVSIEHDLAPTPLRVGVRGGWTRDKIDTSTTGYFPEVPIGRTLTNRYVNPHVSIETPKLGVGLGAVFHDREFLTAGEGARQQADHPLNDFSAHVRFGNPDRHYFAVRWMESEPLYSGGGYLTAGIGVGSRRSNLRVYCGLAAGGPYEGAGPFVQSELDLGSGLSLAVNGRAGPGGAGASAGLGYTFGWRRPEKGLVAAP